MVEHQTDEFVGVGIYSLAEAARLTGVAVGRIRRWVKGYSFGAGDHSKNSAPVWQRQLPNIADTISIGFLDLIEIRFVDAFLKHGVPWSKIRKAETRARDLFGTSHPFARSTFRTDGRTIFANVLTSGKKSLLDVATSQLAFEQIVAPQLKGLEFEKNIAARWWPLGTRRRVVIDPQRSYGQPIVSKEGVPTSVLADAFKVEGTEQAVARWYDVDTRSVRDAVEYENRLAA